MQEEQESGLLAEVHQEGVCVPRPQRKLSECAMAALLPLHYGRRGRQEGCPDWDALLDHVPDRDI